MGLSQGCPHSTPPLPLPDSELACLDHCPLAIPQPPAHARCGATPSPEAGTAAGLLSASHLCSSPQPSPQPQAATLAMGVCGDVSAPPRPGRRRLLRPHAAWSRLIRTHSPDTQGAGAGSHAIADADYLGVTKGADGGATPPPPLNAHFTGRWAGAAGTQCGMALGPVCRCDTQWGLLQGVGKGPQGRSPTQPQRGKHLGTDRAG